MLDASTIHELLCELDQLQITFQEPDLGRTERWTPESPSGKNIFRQLVAKENRDALRKWYASLPKVEINVAAKNLKASLEHAIGEQLP